MAVKKVTGLTLTQESKTFRNDKGEDISYIEYSLLIDNRNVKIKPSNGESKVRFKDAFEKAQSEKLVNLTLTQEPKTFRNDKGEDISYIEYSLLIDNHNAKIKPSNGESKVRLTDVFDKVKPA